MTPPDGRRRLARSDLFDLVALAGGAALCLSPLLRWVRRGPGHTLSGRDMIDALVALGSDIPGLSAARLALAWYLVPASGAAIWVAVGFDRGRRSVSIAAAIVTALVLAAFARLSGVGALGPGAWLAGAGAATALTATLAPSHAENLRQPHPTD